jgi:RNA polymerase primary sigma factor
MSISNRESVLRRNDSNHGTTVVFGRGKGQSSVRHGSPSESIAMRQPGTAGSWCENGNRLIQDQIPSKEERDHREEALLDEISRRRNNGETLGQLAKRFRSTKGRIARILAQQRFKVIQEMDLDFIPNDNFSRTAASVERTILGPPPENRQPSKSFPRPAGLPPYLASMYETPLLTREQEQHLFRKMNYLKYKVTDLRSHLDAHRPSVTAMSHIERLHNDAVSVKNDIVRANLRLVVSIAKRYASGPGHLFELISDGNMSLIRAVEKFDFARGFRFSTYATWAIMKNFARTIPTELRQKARFRTGGEERLLAIQDIRPNVAKREWAQSERELEVSRILRHLDDRERQIIEHRFGLDHSRNPMTLKEVGRVMGVTKERIRQLEARAMAKLRSAVTDELVEAPEDPD